MLKRTKNVVVNVIQRYFICFDFSKFEYEERVKRTICFFTTFPLSIFSIFLGLFFIGDFLLTLPIHCNMSELHSGLLYAGFGAASFLCVVLLIRKMFQTFIVLFSTIGIFGILTAYFLNANRSIIFSAEWNCLSIIPLVMLFIGKRKYISYIYFAMYIIIVIIVLILDLFFTDWLAVVNNINITMELNVMSLYITVTIPSIIYYITIVIIDIYNTKHNKMIMDIAKGIRILDFSSPKLALLKDKKKGKCTQIEIILNDILAKVEEYATYLPDNLKKHSSHSVLSQLSSVPSSSNSDNKNNNSSSYGSSNSSNNYRRDSFAISNNDNDNTLYQSLESDNITTEEENDKTTNLLSKKEITALVLCIKISDNNNTIKTFLDGNIKLITILINNVKKYGGSVLNIYGNKTICLFNAVSRCTEHRKKAIHAAWMVKNEIKNMDIQYRIFINSGNAFCGAMGNAKFKRYNSISMVTHKLDAMEFDSYQKINNIWNGEILCCNDVIVEDNSIKYEFLIRTIKNRQLHKVIKKINLSRENKEWMYKINLHDDVKEEGFEKKWNIIISYIEKGNYTDASSIISNMISDGQINDDQKCDLLFKKYIVTKYI